eukprot:403340096
MNRQEEEEDEYIQHHLQAAANETQQKKCRKRTNTYRNKDRFVDKIKYVKRQSCIFYYDPQNQGTICKFGNACEFSHTWNQFQYQVKENKGQLQISESKVDDCKLQNAITNSKSFNSVIEQQLNYENKKKVASKNDVEINNLGRITLQDKNIKFMRNGYIRRNTKVCQKLDKLQLKTQCSNYSHCLRHIHSYEEVLNEAVVKFDQRKVLISNRAGQSIFKNLNWNITGLILDYLNYKLIMNKIRYINHDTLYMTNERIDHLNIERYVQIKINLENFVPLISHPIVKNARQADIIIQYDKPNFIFHCTNLLIHGAKFFNSMQTMNIKFIQFVDGTFHEQMIQNDKIFINDLLSKLYHLPLYQQLKSLAIDVQQPNRPIFDFRANLKVCLKHLKNLQKLQLPLAYNVLKSNDKIKYDPKDEQIDLESIQEASKLVLVIDVQRVGQLMDTPLHKMNVYKKIMKNSYAQRITEIKFRQGLYDKKSFDNQDKVLQLCRPLNYLTNLKLLDLKNCCLDDNSLLLIVQQPLCQTVDDLRLNKNQITNKSVLNIQISTQLRSLKHLDIRKNNITSLSYSDFNQYQKLKTLKLYDEIEMSEDDMSRFFRGDFVKQIEHLYLRFVGRRSLQLQADQLQNVHEYKMKSLYLQGIVFQERTVAELFPKLVNLETLKLQFCKISGVHNADSFSQLVKLKKLVLINVSSLYDFMRMINSCKDLQKLVVEYKYKELNSFEIKEIKLRKLTSLKIRSWKNRENSHFHEFQKLECFQNLTTLEIPCIEYGHCLKQIMKRKNLLKKLVLFSNTPDILRILILMNKISSKYKHFKNLDFLGFKAMGKYSDKELLDTQGVYFRKYYRDQIERILIKDQSSMIQFNFGNLFKLKGLGLPLCTMIVNNLLCASKQYFSDSKLRNIIFYSRKPTNYSFFQQEALQKFLPLNFEIRLVKCHHIYTTFTKMTTRLAQQDENGNLIFEREDFERRGFHKQLTLGMQVARNRFKGLQLRNREIYNPYCMFDDLLSTEYFQQLEIQQIIEDGNEESLETVNEFFAEYFKSLNKLKIQQKLPLDNQSGQSRGNQGARQTTKGNIESRLASEKSNFDPQGILNKRSDIDQQIETQIVQSQNIMNSVQINTSTAYMPADEWEEERMVQKMVIEESKEQHQEEIKRQKPVEMMRSSIMPPPKND